MNYFEALLAEHDRLSDALLEELPRHPRQAADLPAAPAPMTAGTAAVLAPAPSDNAPVLSGAAAPPVQAASVSDAEALSRIYERDARRYG